MEQKAHVALQRGILIVFEGIDGCGKSTQLELLADVLRTKGYPVITTKEPTDGAYGKQIRALYDNREKMTKEDELDLFLLDRREHVRELLEPSLAAKKVVLCDRYFLSTIAYQGAAGLDPATIADKNGFAPRPDIALLFQIPTKVSIERITEKRGDTPNDFEKESNLLKVSRIFETLDFPYIRRINAAADVDSVHRKVLSLVEHHLENFI